MCVWRNSTISQMKSNQNTSEQKISKIYNLRTTLRCSKPLAVITAAAATTTAKTKMHKFKKQLKLVATALHISLNYVNFIPFILCFLLVKRITSRGWKWKVFEREKVEISSRSYVIVIIFSHTLITLTYTHTNTHSHARVGIEYSTQTI